MTPRQEKLHDLHRDPAITFTTNKEPVYWVLDLSDEVGFAMAEAITQDPQLAAKRDATLANDHIPAYTLAASLESSNRLLGARWGLAPLPYPSKSRKPPIEAAYMVIVSDGRVLVALVPSFSTSTTAKVCKH